MYFSDAVFQVFLQHKTFMIHWNLFFTVATPNNNNNTDSYIACLT